MTHCNFFAVLTTSLLLMASVSNALQSIAVQIKPRPPSTPPPQYLFGITNQQKTAVAATTTPFFLNEQQEDKEIPMDAILGAMMAGTTLSLVLPFGHGLAVTGAAAAGAAYLACTNDAARLFGQAVWSSTETATVRFCDALEEKKRKSTTTYSQTTN